MAVQAWLEYLDGRIGNQVKIDQKEPQRLSKKYKGPLLLSLGYRFEIDQYLYLHESKLLMS